jgi:hypothetical protein
MDTLLEIVKLSDIKQILSPFTSILEVIEEY